jgi:hypothetical protein
MLFANPTLGHRQRLEHLTDEKTGPLVEANDRIPWIVGLRLKPQEVFHQGDEPGVDLA